MHKNKRIKILSVCLIALFIVGGGIWLYLENRPIPESQIMTITSVADPIFTKPEEGYVYVDSVFIGRLGKTVDCYAEDISGVPRTLSKVAVLQTIKGDVPAEVVVSHRGGIVKYSEYLQARSEDISDFTSAENGLDLEKRDIKYVRWESSVPMEEGNEYMFFVFDSIDELGYYYIHIEEYSILKITDNQMRVYRTVADKYESVDTVISRMKEYAASQNAE